MSRGRRLTVGVLALQGAFSEHVQLLRHAALALKAKNNNDSSWQFMEVRTPDQLAECDGLIIPGGESTAISLVAERSGLLEPLRQFVKVSRKPTWGTCAGLILLAESANRTKKGGQELIGGLDVRVNRNHFGRQTESFQAALDLPFLADLNDKTATTASTPFRSVFIRAPVVERVLPHTEGIQAAEAAQEDTVVAPSQKPDSERARRHFDAEVEVLARLPARAATYPDGDATARMMGEDGDIIAVRQGNVFGTSFHPELTGDSRIHEWWLKTVLSALESRE